MVNELVRINDVSMPALNPFSNITAKNNQTANSNPTANNNSTAKN
jgi:hypothetical protein